MDGSYLLNIGKTKMQRRFDTLVPLPLREGPCAAALLPRYLATLPDAVSSDLLGPLSQPLFPGLLQGAWRSQVKALAASIGLDPLYYSGHSFRVGAATDLFELKLPYYVIKKLGRWKSDAALFYYRSDTEAHAMVFEAYDRLFRRWRKQWRGVSAS